MQYLNLFVLIILGAILPCCHSTNGYLPEKQLGALKEIAEENQWIEYSGNPVVQGTPGEFDAGALGNMSVLIVDGVVHMYYETWERRQAVGFLWSDYITLSVGHATSRDGIHFQKDENNPVLPRGEEGEFDHTGTWDPFVLYEDGIYKMWYGGGGGPFFAELGYATSEDGSHFTKQKQLTDYLEGVAEMHVVHDCTSQKYYMYYVTKYAPGLRRAGSNNETDFDFNNSIEIRIDGESYPGDYRYTHVIIEDGNWYMFYSNFYSGCGALTSTVRMATSSDGVNWKLVNNNILPGLDAEILKVGQDLYALYYALPGDYDEPNAAVNLTVYQGKLNDIPIKREPVVISEEIKERTIARRTENHLYRYDVACDFSEEQLACLEQILEQRNRKDFEIWHNLAGEEQIAQKQKYGQIFHKKIIECIGADNQKRMIEFWQKSKYWTCPYNKQQS